MTDAFNLVKIINKTNGLYRELKQVEKEYSEDFMGRTAKRDYLNHIKAVWIKETGRLP